jgi:hypothetical protein
LQCGKTCGCKFLQVGPVSGAWKNIEFTLVKP